MEDDEDARECHNVMRRFLPLVLGSEASQSHMQSWKQTNYLSIYPRGANWIKLWVMENVHATEEKLQLADISSHIAWTIKDISQPDSQLFMNNIHYS